MEIGHRGSSRSVKACTVQVPLEGVLQQGGVAFVLRAGSGQWVSSQTRGTKQLDFYVSCREVGCLLRPRNDPQRPPANAWGSLLVAEGSVGCRGLGCLMVPRAARLPCDGQEGSTFTGPLSFSEGAKLLIPVSDH